MTELEQCIAETRQANRDEAAAKLQVAADEAALERDTEAAERATKVRQQCEARLLELLRREGGA